MQVAQIGPWEFEMPEGWLHTPNESSSSYFENREGTRGLYVKAIELSEPKESASQLASYLQDLHLNSFTEGTDKSWVVVDRRVSIEGEFARSALDIYDAAANYRVLSLVLATSTTAVQVSVHDYWCENYDVARDDFASLEASIVRVASGA